MELKKYLSKMLQRKQCKCTKIDTIRENDVKNIKMDTIRKKQCGVIKHDVSSSFKTDRYRKKRIVIEIKKIVIEKKNLIL